MAVNGRRTAPTVSIITPTYNHESYIDCCIRSVLAQSFGDWEMLIIDDGSTDSTAEKIKAYEDPRIVFLEQQHAGALKLADTYNRALSLSRGELIAILEGDDYWPENKLEIQVPRILHDGHCVLIWGRAIFVDSNAKHTGQTPAANDKRTNGSYSMLEELLRTNPIPAVSVVMRGDALRSIGGFRRVPGLPSVDFPTWLSLSAKGTFWYVEDIVGYWRRHESQVTMKNNVEIRQRENQYIEEFYSSLDKAQKKELTIDEGMIRANNSRRLSSAYFRRGRIFLMKKDWRKARAAFLEAFRHGGTGQRLASLCGAAMSFLHRDIERIAGLLHRDTLPKVANR